jgi:hypothetical protein
MSAHTVDHGEQGRSPKFQSSCGPGRVPVRERAQDLPSRRNMPACTLVIPSHKLPDPSDLPEHIDRASPCSMLEEASGPTVPPKSGSNPQRPKVRIEIPEQKQPDPSGHPDHCDQLSPGSLLSSW